MRYRDATVLLGGDTVARSTVLRKWLTQAGCSCRVAASYEAACAWLAHDHFDLVLSTYQMADRTAFPLLDWIEGSPSSLIFCAKSGRETRWLPMIEHGERRLDRPPLKSRNLPNALEKMLNARAQRSPAGSKPTAEELEQVGAK
jgi:DNA-binding NtrC family response regulator